MGRCIDNGYTVASVELIGSASDDWQTEESLGITEPENGGLASDRVESVFKELKSSFFW